MKSITITENGTFELPFTDYADFIVYDLAFNQADRNSIWYKGFTQGASIAPEAYSEAKVIHNIALNRWMLVK